MDNQLKKIGLLFYTAGRFEGLKADAGSTLDFIAKDDGRVLQDVHDLAILRDMKEAWYSITPDHQLTIEDYIRAHGAMIASTNAAHPGELRTHPVRVAFAGGERQWTADYVEVTESIFTEKLNEALENHDVSDDIRAARAFFNVAKLQPFPDGNKRTAIIVANRMLLPENKVLLVPYEDDDYREFMRALEGFDRGQFSLEEVSEWFATFVKDVDNLDVEMPFGNIIELNAITRPYDRAHFSDKLPEN